MLRNVALGLPSASFQQRVISLTTREPIGSQLETGGIAVMASGGKSPLRLLALRAQARRWVADWQPDVIHCWMYHANVFGRTLLGASKRGARPVYLASVRGALNSPRAQRRMLRMVRWIDARTSRAADALLFNSRVSAAQHQQLGYAGDHALVIPNGFDSARFAPDAAIRARMRAELRAGDDIVVGMVARFEPVKGHEVLLRAVALMKDAASRCRVVLAGRGCDPGNAALVRLIDELGIGARVALVGERGDIPDLLNAFDVAVCPSLSESFPNAVGEAMSSGLPCIVTDVGDCAFLVGDTGRVTPPADAQALSSSITELIDLGVSGRRSLGVRARSRILENFSMPAVLDRYAGLYERLVSANRQRH
jgi:glycosyltransferase involved in cell wall biosynthesis